jgi:hypothetical protein
VQFASIYGAFRFRRAAYFGFGGSVSIARTLWYYPVHIANFLYEVTRKFLAGQFLEPNVRIGLTFLLYESSVLPLN